MTAEEALRAVADTFLSENTQSLTEVIRALGFVIIPAEPSEATIERMAESIIDRRKLPSDCFTNWPVFRDDARAAYAAIVAPPAGAEEPAPRSVPAIGER